MNAMPAALERVAHRVELGRRGRDLPGVALVLDVLGAGFERGEHEVVLGGGGLVEQDHALALELPAHRAGLGERAAVAGEGVLHLGAGAVAVVGERLDVDRDAVRRVALVVHLLVGDALELTGPPLDRPLDVVLGHRGVARLLHHRAQRRVALDVAAALARRDLDLAGEPGEDLAPRRVGRALRVLDRMPLGMPAHAATSCEEPLVQSQIAGQLGMERRRPDRGPGGRAPDGRRGSRAPRRRLARTRSTGRG